MPLLAESAIKFWMGISLVEQKSCQREVAAAVLKARRRNERRDRKRELLAAVHA